MLKDWCWSSNTLATWCKESTHWKRPWCWERLGMESRERQRMRWLGGISDSLGMSLSKLRERVKDREACCAIVRGVTESRIGLHNWTTTICEEDQEHGLSPGHSVRPECSFFGRREWEYLGMGRLCDSRNDPAAKINTVQAVHAWLWSPAAELQKGLAAFYWALITMACT